MRYFGNCSHLRNTAPLLLFKLFLIQPIVCCWDPESKKYLWSKRKHIFTREIFYNSIVRWFHILQTHSTHSYNISGLGVLTRFMQPRSPGNLDNQHRPWWISRIEEGNQDMTALNPFLVFLREYILESFGTRWPVDTFWQRFTVKYSLNIKENSLNIKENF